MSPAFDRSGEKRPAGTDDRFASTYRSLQPARFRRATRATVLACLGLAAALLATSCATTPGTGTRTGASSKVDSPSVYQRLIKGMRRAEVARYLGKPDEVTPFTTEGAAGEIWKYSKVSPGPTRQVSTEMRDIETVDPISGLMTMRKEPVYRNELTTITEVAELLFIKDLLVEWKQQRFADRQVN